MADGAVAPAGSVMREDTGILQTCTEQEVEEWNRIHKWGLMTRTIANYQRLEQVGEGTYGKVYKARCISTGRDVALKKIRVHHGGYKGLPTTAIREIKIMKQLHHKNMVELIEVVTSKGVEFLDEDENPVDDKRNREKDVEKDKKKISPSDLESLAVERSTPKNSKKDKLSDKNMDPREGFKGNLFLVLEYVSHDLTGLMDMCYRFSEVQVKCIFRQLLDVLDYIHTNNYVHRDLKCSNILLTNTYQLKLADFGLARCLDNSSYMFDNVSLDDVAGKQDLTNKVITLWYRPPELLLGETRYGTSVDIWSAGCILAELLLGRPLFTGKTEMEQLSLIFDLVGTPTRDRWEGFNDLKLLKSGEFTIGKVKNSSLRQKYGNKNKMNSTAIDLLEKLLELDPSKRMTAGRAMTSRYFLTEPRAPENPDELGRIDPCDNGVGGHFHEFQTKKRRREAKMVGEKAKKEAKANGLSEKEAEAAYHTSYEEHIRKLAVEKPQNEKRTSPSLLPMKDRMETKEAEKLGHHVKSEVSETNIRSKSLKNPPRSSRKELEAVNNSAEGITEDEKERHESVKILSSRHRYSSAELSPPRHPNKYMSKESNDGIFEQSSEEQSGRHKGETESAEHKGRRNEASEGGERQKKMKSDGANERDSVSEGGKGSFKILDAQTESSNRSELENESRRQYRKKSGRGRKTERKGSGGARSRSRSSSSSSSSSYLSTTSSESSTSKRRRRHSRSKKRRRSRSHSREKSARRSSDRRGEKGRDHPSRYRNSEVYEGVSGSQREWGRERKSQSGGERTHHERHSDRHKHGNERVREHDYYEASGRESWDQFDRFAGRETLDPRWRLNDAPWDTRKGQPGYDLPPRNWSDPAYSHENPLNSDRWHRASDQPRYAFDTSHGPSDPGRHGRRDRSGNPERGKRR
jgi:cyclin-dependent kinase 12/13